MAPPVRRNSPAFPRLPPPPPPPPPRPPEPVRPPVQRQRPPDTFVGPRTQPSGPVLRQGPPTASAPVKESPAREAVKNPETYAKALDTGLTVQQNASALPGSRQHYTDARADGNSRLRSLATSTRNTLRDTVEGGRIRRT